MVYKKNPQKWYPKKVRYGGKKYYMMTKPDYIINNNKNHIIYYCTSHRINTANKKFQIRKNPCEGQIKYIINKNKFYITHFHNKISDIIKEKIYDNIADINGNIIKFSYFKKILIDFLNHNPMINFNSFKQKSVDLYMKNKYEFNATKNTFHNIFYQWKRNSKIFSWYNIFDNCYTKDQSLYLKDVYNSYIYNTKGDNMTSISILYGFQIIILKELGIHIIIIKIQLLYQQKNLMSYYINVF